MIKIEAEKFRAGLEFLEAAIIQAATMAMRDAVRATEASGKQTTLFKDRSGDTRGSIRGEVESLRRGRVTFGGMSRLLDSGTRPHTITARRAQFLRFVMNGQTVYRRSVNHPGTAERPFVREARARGEQVMAYAMDFYVGEAIRRAR